MFFVVPRSRLARLIAITRDDRTTASQGPTGPFFRIEASSDQQVRLTGRFVEVTVPATVHEPGVLFLRVTMFRKVLALSETSGYLAIQLNADALIFDDVRLPLHFFDMLFYPDTATAPLVHPAERGEGPEQLPPFQPGLFGG